MPDTRFDPRTHGFTFLNNFPGGAVVAEAARQGRLHELTGIPLPGALRQLANIAQSASFWGSFGLCGGMSWAALDRYFTGRLAKDDPPAKPGNPLFSELVKRQIDSMKRTALIGRCLRWQVLPERTPSWLFWKDGVHELTGRREWPDLKSSIDRGLPASLTLIRASGVANPSINHQVVAIGYEKGEGNNISVRLCDPNHPRSVTALNLRFEPGGNLVNCSLTTGESVRGFFMWPYQPPS